MVGSSSPSPALSASMSPPPQTTEQPQITLSAVASPPPQTTELPQTTDEPLRKASPPQTTEAPQITELFQTELALMLTLTAPVRSRITVGESAEPTESSVLLRAS